MKVVNLFGGPGSGKSTTAAGIFYEMKMANVKVELVTEYAKELFYGGILEVMTVSGQERIFAEQSHRIERLVGQVDYAITDSPLLLSLVYGPQKPTTDAYHQLVFETFSQYDNHNFFIRRPASFEEGGRMQNHEQSIEVDNKILAAFDKYNVPVTHVNADQFLVRRILSLLDF